MANGEYLGVRELLTDTGLELTLLTGEIGLDRAVRGIHLSDYDDPTPWMASDTVLITTGAPFKDSPQAGIAFLDKIAEKDTVALGVGIGHHVTHVWPAMVKHARTLRVPIFEIPPSVPFRALFAYVYNALASTDMHRLRRGLAVQGQLLDLLLEDKGISDVLARLAEILDMGVILYDAHGAVVAQAGASHLRPALVDRIWETYSSVDDLGPLNVLEVEHGRFHIRRVVVYGVVERVLAAVAEQAPASAFAELALSYAQRLIALDLQREREQITLRRRIRALLLDDLLSRAEVDEDLAQRLLDQDIDLTQPERVLVATVSPRDDSGKAGTTPDERDAYRLKAELQTTVEAFLAKRRIACIGMVKGEAVVVLAVVGARDTEATHALLVELREAAAGRLAQLDVRIGASSVSTGASGLASAFRQARESCRAAREGVGVLDGVVLFEEAGGRFRLLRGQSDESLHVLCERFVAPLRQHDRMHGTYLLPTLRTFFDNRLSVHLTAGALYIHRNTLGKRLRRIEELLHVDLDRIDDVFELYLALRASELLETVSDT